MQDEMLNQTNESLSKYDKPVRFHEIKESVMNSPEFSRLRDSSVNKVLDRVMMCLRGVSLVIRCEGRKDRRVSDVYYFRMFSFLNDSDNGCEDCEDLCQIKKANRRQTTLRPLNML
jgi:hypothetical protein